MDRSKRFTLFAYPGRPVHSDTNSVSPGSMLFLRDKIRQNKLAMNIILDAISRVQTDIKLLDNKLSEHISSLSCQTSVSSLYDKETIDALTKECDSLRSTIDMLMTPPSREVELCSNSSPCATSRNGRRASPGQANPPNQTVPTTNSFAVLASHDLVIIDSDITVNSETDAALNSISEVLKPCDHNGKPESDTPLTHQTSYQMQINQYRNKHKKLSTTKSQPSVSVKKQRSPTHKHTNSQANTAADILVIGDSMIKHLQPGCLSRKLKVICRTMRGAKIEDVAQRAKETASKHSVSEVIVHVWSIWHSTFMSIINHHAPMKSKRIRGNALPWLDGEIIQLMRQRDRAHKIAKR